MVEIRVCSNAFRINFTTEAVESCWQAGEDQLMVCAVETLAFSILFCDECCAFSPSPPYCVNSQVWQCLVEEGLSWCHCLLVWVWVIKPADYYVAELRTILIVGHHVSSVVSLCFMLTNICFKGREGNCLRSILNLYQIFSRTIMPWILFWKCFAITKMNWAKRGKGSGGGRGTLIFLWYSLHLSLWWGMRHCTIHRQFFCT